MKKLTERPGDLAKGEWGRLLILAGSEPFAGAAVLNTLGALRTGLDLVVVGTPENAADAVTLASSDPVAIRLPGPALVPSHLDQLERFAAGYTVVIGSGLSINKDSRKFLKLVLERFAGPFVIDADALEILAEDRDAVDWYADKSVVLTPNREEYALLAGEAKPHPASSIEGVSKQYRATILSKGETDVISDGETILEVEGGSPFLAKAGTGDVLAGSVGALLARGLEPIEAAKVGAELVKEAGERGALDKGPSLLASDIPGYLDLRKLP